MKHDNILSDKHEYTLEVREQAACLSHLETLVLQVSRLVSIYRDGIQNFRASQKSPVQCWPVYMECFEVLATFENYDVCCRALRRREPRGTSGGTQCCKICRPASPKKPIRLSLPPSLPLAKMQGWTWKQHVSSSNLAQILPPFSLITLCPPNCRESLGRACFPQVRLHGLLQPSHFLEDEFLFNLPPSKVAMEANMRSYNPEFRFKNGTARNAPRLPKEKWDEHKDLLCSLYLEKTVAEILAFMRTEHGFMAKSVLFSPAHSSLES
jgi:hypothetical protein